MTDRAETRAHAQGNILARTVDLTVVANGHVLEWPYPEFAADPVEPGQVIPPSLVLREDVARAVYEALADYFGHAGHDARALRKDYEAERRRVDKVLDYLTGSKR